MRVKGMDVQPEPSVSDCICPPVRPVPPVTGPHPPMEFADWLLLKN